MQNRNIHSHGKKAPVKVISNETIPGVRSSLHPNMQNERNHVNGKEQNRFGNYNAAGRPLRNIWSLVDENAIEKPNGKEKKNKTSLLRSKKDLQF